VPAGLPDGLAIGEPRAVDRTDADRDPSPDGRAHADANADGRPDGGADPDASARHTPARHARAGDPGTIAPTHLARRPVVPPLRSRA
jgi:hypothetical protein